MIIFRESAGNDSAMIKNAGRVSRSISFDEVC